MNELSINETFLELLVLVGQIDVSILEKIRLTVAKTNLSPQKIVVLSGTLTAEQAESATLASAMVERQELSMTKAAILLAKAFCTRTSLKQLIDSFEYGRISTLSVALIISGFLELSKVGYLLARSSDCNIDGYELWKNGLITLDQWKNTLEHLVALKQHAITTKELLFEGLINIPEEMEEADLREAAVLPQVRLGDLLLEARLISETDLLRALEVSSDSSEMIGKLLVSRALATQSIIDSALRILELLRMDLLPTNDAVSLLREYAEQAMASHKKHGNVNAPAWNKTLLKTA